MWLIIILLILVRVLYFYAQPDLTTDHLSQMAMAQHFLEGNGFSFKYLSSDLNIFYSTHIQWPPLYPFILALISFVTGNTLLSSFIIQIAVLVSLMFIWNKIFILFNNLISEKAYFYFISLLIISTSIINNINTILVFSLLLLSLSLYFTFSYLFDKESKIALIFSSFFAGLLFWTHYSYFFVAFYPAVVFGVIFYLRKEKKYLFTALASFALSFIVALGVLVYNYITTGFINYMDNPHIWNAGFFPEHLLLTDPFFLNAFFNSSYFYHYILKTEHDVLLTISLQIISFAVFITICFLLLKLRKNKSLPFDKSSLMFLPFIAIIFTTISFLLYFTLHYNEIPRPGWTHIGDPRYLSPVYLAILAIVILLMSIKADYFNKKFLSFLKQLILILIVLSLAINIFITFKEWGNYSFNKNIYNMPEVELQALFDNIKLEASLGKKVVFIDNDLTVRSFRISQYAGAAVINSNEAVHIKNFNSNFVFFFFLPVTEQYRDEDYRLLQWCEKFNSKFIGKVYTKLNLYKVNSL
ncbi:MAG TPA: hypothetical protein DHV28_00915 [Ignavibacteriales bacterium]|nr:hypothetical protein [Ignavibacteriales bacterium]